MARISALYATSITSGFCMMALEILGARVLQPFFGSGIDVWAAIISVFILKPLHRLLAGRAHRRQGNEQPPSPWC